MSESKTTAIIVDPTVSPDAVHMRIGGRTVGKIVNIAPASWTGLPPDPTKNGWHWLRWIGHSTLEPWYWRASDQVWDTNDDGHPGYMAKHLIYIAPCPYPEMS